MLRLPGLSPTGKRYKDSTCFPAYKSSAGCLNRLCDSIPEYLAKHNFQNPEDPKDCVGQLAFDAPDKSFGDILRAGNYGPDFRVVRAKVWGENHSQVQELYPIKERLVDGFRPGDDAVFWVDVGGGYGQRTQSLKNSMPDLPGRLIVQDLAPSIDAAPKIEGIELMVHDFFTEQPVKGDSKSLII